MNTIESHIYNKYLDVILTHMIDLMREDKCFKDYDALYKRIIAIKRMRKYGIIIDNHFILMDNHYIHLGMRIELTIIELK